MHRHILYAVGCVLLWAYAAQAQPPQHQRGIPESLQALHAMIVRYGVCMSFAPVIRTLVSDRDRQVPLAEALRLLRMALADDPPHRALRLDAYYTQMAVFIWQHPRTPFPALWEAVQESCTPELASWLVGH